ncbi:uncharacterized protein LOC142954918 isoform X2 [Anarhichas minor]|uniref:uncharacterized protein LOC142954918 isoform X2 n=1 Tax=Anarhichas minor TaxID=65739 RepID=UPI003F73EE4A
MTVFFFRGRSRNQAERVVPWISPGTAVWAGVAIVLLEDPPPVKCGKLPGRLIERCGTAVTTLLKVLYALTWRPAPSAPQNSQTMGTEVHRQTQRGNKRSSVFPMSTAKFQRVVLGKLVDLIEEVKRIGRGVEHEGLQRQVPTLNSNEELDELEGKLKNAEQRALLVHLLANVGGKNIKDATNKIMDRLFTNRLMATFNMKGGGQRNKSAFRETELYSVVKEAVIRSDPSATESKVDRAMADHLKQAPGRSGGGGF